MISIAFPAPASLMNMNTREHWARKSEKTKAWRQASCVAARNAIAHGLHKHQPFSIVQLVLPVHSLKVRRDPHNFYPTVKACVDGLVSAGLFEDDSSAFLATVEPAFKQGGDVEVLITDATEATG